MNYLFSSSRQTIHLQKDTIVLGQEIAIIKALKIILVFFLKKESRQRLNINAIFPSGSDQIHKITIKTKYLIVSNKQTSNLLIIRHDIAELLLRLELNNNLLY